MAYEDQDEEGRDARENESGNETQEDTVTEDGEQKQSPGAVLGSVASEYKGKHGPHAGLTIAESLRMNQDLQGGVDSPLLNEEVPCGEYVGLTRREAYAFQHEEEGVFPELAVREEMALKTKFYGERQRSPNGEWLRDAKGALLPVIGVDRTLPIFDTPVPSGKWKGYTRRGVLTAVNEDDAMELRSIVEREILARTPIPEEMRTAAIEIIDIYFTVVFVDAEGDAGAKTRFGRSISDDAEEFDNALKELDVDRVQRTLVNQLLVGRITLYQATERMKDFGREFIALLVKRREEEEPVSKSMPLGGEYSTRGEIKDALIKFYERGGQPKDAWRPGNLFVYGADKSNCYKVYRKWLAARRGG